jgi:N-6 DNA Methylase
MIGEEIKRNLVEFARKWSLYEGTERAEAQTFLNELFVAYGQDRYEVGAHFEEPQAGRFLDLLWPRVCLVEMKRPSEATHLAKHREQALAYWSDAADPERNVPAPQYVVLCAFHRFEVWEPGAYPTAPRAEFALIELPERLDALMFLAGRDAVFVGTQAAVTQEAVELVTGLFATLGERRAGPPDELRDFALQCVWCMFAEDLGQLEAHLFTHILDELIANPERSSADDLGQLFEWLNRDAPRPGGGLYATTRYVNGMLFQHPARIHLDQQELITLRSACEYDWQKVEPHIFGSLLEGALGRESQWALGAHYTHEVDIQKVVKPSIIDPWRERIEDASTLDQVRRLQNELLNYVVLDPACGSGNFLYIAYRELRRVEQRLHDRELDLRRAQGRRQATQGALTAFFPLTNIKGIEINAFAVALARVTLWMGHKLAVDELDLDEATLPLENLPGIQAADALRIDWPRASVIIGNPPFHGDRHLRGLLGDDYVKWLQETFHCGVKDHCVYWFRKAQDHLEPGQRAGLVGTNSISQNRARSASLNYIVENGGVITNAVSSQDWPGAANVDVSIVNWIKRPPDPPSVYQLDNNEVQAIDTALTESTIPIADVPRIDTQVGIAFQGFLPGAEFDISRERAAQMLARSEASYTDVVKPYLDGRDITRSIDQSPGRYTIDFGQMSLEQAIQYPLALEILRSQAKGAREESTSYHRNPRWWQFLWPRPEFRQAARGLDRFIAGSATGKRIFFIWCEPDWRPSNSTNIFALADDFSIGVLTSRVHTDWAAKKSSTLEDRIRYTPSSAFDTFPWPQATGVRRELIGALARELLAARSAHCVEHAIGLTDLYNRLDDGAFEDLRSLHRRLDIAVIEAFGWRANVLDDTRERNRRLYELNREIVAGDHLGYKGPG